MKSGVTVIERELVVACGDSHPCPGKVLNILHGLTKLDDAQLDELFTLLAFEQGQESFQSDPDRTRQVLQSILPVSTFAHLNK